MTPRALAPLLLAASLASTGCVAVAPLATVAVIETFENAVGRRLDPSPPPVDTAQTAAHLDAAGSPVPGSSGADPAAVPSTGADATPAPVDPGFVTMNMFNQVQNGMSYEEVVKIFGREGQLLPGTRAVIYVWSNPNSSYVRVVFSARQVADKQQERLS